MRQRAELWGGMRSWSKADWERAIERVGLHPFLIAFASKTATHLKDEHGREFVYGNPRENARRHLVAHGVLTEDGG